MMRCCLSPGRGVDGADLFDASRAGACAVALTNVQRLKCTFTQKALGTWDKDVAPASR